MDPTDAVRTLRLVRPDDPAGDAATSDAGSPADAPLTTQAYWARVQSLRADRDRLRPAN